MYSISKKVNKWNSTNKDETRRTELECSHQQAQKEIINNNARIEGSEIHIDKHYKQYADIVTDTEDYNNL